jgi:branched-chain amino acid transport system ATP-binding protein
MRTICGLLACEPEMVRWNDQAIGHLRADQIAKLGIAMVPEGRQLFPSLSVEENLKIGAQGSRSGHWNLKRVYELFPVLGERRDQGSTTLSGGQQQMVAIGRALMSNPEIILFDEISLGLAPIIINQIYDALPNIIDNGLSALLVEQDINRALTIADRCYCLSEGKITLAGSTDTVTREDVSHAYFGV